jgi:hypothetical protein
MSTELEAILAELGTDEHRVMLVGPKLGENSFELSPRRAVIGGQEHDRSRDRLPVHCYPHVYGEGASSAPRVARFYSDAATCCLAFDHNRAAGHRS